MSEIWARIAQQVSGGSRTDVLRGLVWPNALLLTALVWASLKDAPSAILILLGALLLFFMLLYAAAFVFFAIKDPNLLRSERYNIEKMAIERGVYGDSISGITEQPRREMLPSPVTGEVPDGNEA